ncbi:MAG: hypothetical protein RL077_6066, partial [Verrucomicrobiota bacterium]
FRTEDCAVTTCADIRVPHPTPGLASPCFPPWTKATLRPQSEFSIKFCFLRVTCAFADSFFTLSSYYWVTKKRAQMAAEMAAEIAAQIAAEIAAQIAAEIAAQMTAGARSPLKSHFP